MAVLTILMTGAAHRQAVDPAPPATTTKRPCRAGIEQVVLHPVLTEFQELIDTDPVVWNDFFTRSFKDGERPVASPDDDKVIVSACESTPDGISTDVKRQDRFWIKSQPYSLEDMLASDDSVDQFTGGTVYQAFLSATNYHRWHSPVAGTIVRAFEWCDFPGSG